MPARNRLTTANGYTAANTLTGLTARTVTLSVNNAVVTVQFIAPDKSLGHRDSAFNFNTEEAELLPGVWTIGTDDYPDGIAGVRVKSATAGAPAIVSIVAT